MIVNCDEQHIVENFVNKVRGKEGRKKGRASWIFRCNLLQIACNFMSRIPTWRKDWWHHIRSLRSTELLRMSFRNYQRFSGTSEWETRLLSLFLLLLLLVFLRSLSISLPLNMCACRRQIDQKNRREQRKVKRKKFQGVCKGGGGVDREKDRCNKSIDALVDDIVWDHREVKNVDGDEWR